MKQPHNGLQKTAIYQPRTADPFIRPFGSTDVEGTFAVLLLNILVFPGRETGMERLS